MNRVRINKSVLILLVGLMLFGCVEKQKEELKRPNIILFFSDELDPGYVSAYGGNIPTPAIDKMASEGLRFESAYVAAPMCTPSRFSLLSGLYPGRCNDPEFLKDFPIEEPYIVGWNTWLTEEIATIPKVLSQHGYFTGMVGKWHIGKLSKETDVPEFDENPDLDDPETSRKLRSLQDIHIDKVKSEGGFDYVKSLLWGNFDGFVIKTLRYHNFPWITRGAIDFLDEAKNSDKPFFLYSATTAVHGPGHTGLYNMDVNYTLEGKLEGIEQYRLDPDSMKQVLAANPPGGVHKYAGMASVDHHVNLVLRKLKGLDMDDNTMVIFMADHNIEPGKTTCYEKGLKVPLIIKWPNRIKPNTVSKVMVQSIDLFPTIMELADIESGNIKLDGKAINSVLAGSEENIHDYIYSESGLQRSVSNGRYKYIAFRYPKYRTEQLENGDIDYAPNGMNMERQAHAAIALQKFPAYFDADQLYDLNNDPYEQNNLAYDPDFKDIKTKMQEALKGYLSGFNHAYHMEDTAFMRTEKYAELAQKTRDLGTDWISWIKRDHGSIKWPPEE